MNFEHMTKELDIRLAKTEDIPAMMQCIRDAQARLAAAGIDQWQDGYPNDEQLSNDISLGDSYIILDNESIIGTVCVSFAGDTNYLEIDGAWHHEEPYVVLHRIAIRDSHLRQRLAERIFKFAIQLAMEKGVRLFRVDTHQDNMAMQHLLKKLNFEYCGIIRVRGGALRNAYDLKW